MFMELKKMPYVIWITSWKRRHYALQLKIVVGVPGVGKFSFLKSDISICSVRSFGLLTIFNLWSEWLNLNISGIYCFYCIENNFLWLFWPIEFYDWCILYVGVSYLSARWFSSTGFNVSMDTCDYDYLCTCAFMKSNLVPGIWNMSIFKSHWLTCLYVHLYTLW